MGEVRTRGSLGSLASLKPSLFLPLYFPVLGIRPGCQECEANTPPLSSTQALSRHCLSGHLSASLSLLHSLCLTLSCSPHSSSALLPLWSSAYPTSSVSICTPLSPCLINVDSFQQGSCVFQIFLQLLDVNLPILQLLHHVAQPAGYGYRHRA